MKKYHSLIKNWFIISIATCIFSYLLWALMDFDTFVGTGVTFEDLCFDIVYCSFYTLFSLWVSISLGLENDIVSLFFGELFGIVQLSALKSGRQNNRCRNNRPGKATASGFVATCFDLIFFITG